jgi:proteasome lid subunit RPN8/RPN11
MLLLSARARADLERWVRAGYPRETCGVLVGRHERGLTRVAWAAQARNRAEERARDRYDLDPGDYVAADLFAREQGLCVVGIWHSHPDHPSVPSETDLRAATEHGPMAGWSYLILSVAERGVEDLRSWRLNGGEFREERLRAMSNAVIRIPTPLRGFTRGQDEVSVECATVGEALRELGERAPGILERVLDGEGRLRPFVNVFVGPSDVRALAGLESSVPEGAVISIVPAVAGGGAR